MKGSIRILLGCLAILVVSIVGATVSNAEPASAFEFVKHNAALMAAAPAIVSSSITPELIQDVKVKYGKIKLITVVVESPVYDIDNVSFEDRMALHKLGIDFSTVINPELKLDERLKPLEALNELSETGDSTTIASKLKAKYTGKEIEPGEQYQFLIRRPDRGLIKMLLPLAQDGKLDDFSDKAVKNLVIGGDMQALEDGLVFMGVVSQLKGMISPAQSFLSNA